MRTQLLLSLGYVAITAFAAPTPATNEVGSAKENLDHCPPGYVSSLKGSDEQGYSYVCSANGGDTALSEKDAWQQYFASDTTPNTMTVEKRSQGAGGCGNGHDFNWANPYDPCGENRQ